MAATACSAVGNRFETALFETIHHHARFMARTRQAPGWTSQFREIVMTVDADLHDLRTRRGAGSGARSRQLRRISSARAAAQGRGSNGIAYLSIRHPSGECVALFYPDCASNSLQGRHLDYHWDGARVDLVRDVGSGAVFRIVDLPPDPA